MFSQFVENVSLGDCSAGLVGRAELRPERSEFIYLFNKERDGLVRTVFSTCRGLKTFAQRCVSDRFGSPELGRIRRFQISSCFY